VEVVVVDIREVVEVGDTRAELVGGVVDINRGTDSMTDSVVVDTRVRPVGFIYVSLCISFLSSCVNYSMLNQIIFHVE